MKKSKIMPMILIFVTVALCFCGCSKSIENSGKKLYYDLKGNSYEQKVDIHFYDKDDNDYHLEMVEDYLPNYVCSATGVVLNGFQCYVTNDGYLYYDENNSLERKDGTVDTYLDSVGGEYYDISTVYWDSNGNLCHGLS